MFKKYSINEQSITFLQKVNKLKDHYLLDRDHDNLILFIASIC